MNKPKPLKRGAIAGILLFVVVIIYIFFSIASYFMGVPPLATSIVSMIFTAVLTVLSIFFYKAFIVLAEKNNAKLLRVVTVIGIVFSIFWGVFSVGMGIYQISAGTYNNYPAGFSPEILNATNAGDYANYSGGFGSFIGILILFIILAIFFIVLTILWGVGMLKIGDKFPLAKTIGILDIAAGGLFVTIILAIVSIVLLAVSGVMKIVLLFEASKFYKE